MRVTESRSPGRSRTDPARRWSQRGQGLVIFAAAIVFFVGFLAIVIDVTWYWMNSLKVQRAADAAALAGAVMLPDNPTAAVSRAFAEATKNGYTTGTNGATVTAAQNPSRDIQLDTSVTAPVSTFFMHLFGINTITASRRAAAEYVLPVPMGSPLNYFGAFGAIRGNSIHADTGQTLDDPWDLYPTTSGAAATGWTLVDNAFLQDSQYAQATGTTAGQTWGTYRIPTYFTGTSQTFTGSTTRPYGGIEVDVHGHASNAAGCYIKVDVTPDAGAHWYGSASPTLANGETATPGASQLLGTSDTDLVFGGKAATSATDFGDWFGASTVSPNPFTWNTARFADGTFNVRITPTNASCQYFIDSVGVRVYYDEVNPPIAGPHGESLTKQGVWAGILSQGSNAGSGDAYMPKYMNNYGSQSTQYNATGYYDYAIEMPVGASNGKVYIFDPGYCQTGSFSDGMGDQNYGSTAGTSTFYDLYDTNNTLYDTSDDTWIAGNTGPAGSSNPNYGLFRQLKQYDPSQNGSAPSGGTGWTSCERGQITAPTNGGYWHNRWWQINSSAALAGPTNASPRIYRVHVTSTDPYATSDQLNTRTLNNFSFFASASNGTPRVYGLGTMVAFAPLKGGSSVDLYMSQISATYAGKTMKVSLFDPGDTNGPANLQFLQPTTTGLAPASFTWTSVPYGSDAACTNRTQATPVTSITTNNGSNLFNSCWVIISIPVGTAYTAPTPPGEPGPGWWKIRYNVTGASDASDLTTWKTQMVGNPVHLVTP